MAGCVVASAAWLMMLAVCWLRADAPAFASVQGLAANVMLVAASSLAIGSLLTHGTGYVWMLTASSLTVVTLSAAATSGRKAVGVLVGAAGLGACVAGIGYSVVSLLSGDALIGAATVVAAILLVLAIAGVATTFGGTARRDYLRWLVLVLAGGGFVCAGVALQLHHAAVLGSLVITLAIGYLCAGIASVLDHAALRDAAAAIIGMTFGAAGVLCLVHDALLIGVILITVGLAIAGAAAESHLHRAGLWSGVALTVEGAVAIALGVTILVRVVFHMDALIGLTLITIGAAATGVGVANIRAALAGHGPVRLTVWLHTVLRRLMRPPAFIARGDA